MIENNAERTQTCCWTNNRVKAEASLRQREKRSRVGTGEYQMPTGLLIKNESRTAAVESGHGQEVWVELSLYRTHLETVSLIRKWSLDQHWCSSHSLVVEACLPSSWFHALPKVQNFSLFSLLTLPNKWSVLVLFHTRDIALVVVVVVSVLYCPTLGNSHGHGRSDLRLLR